MKGMAKPDAQGNEDDEGAYGADGAVKANGMVKSDPIVLPTPESLVAQFFSSGSKETPHPRTHITCATAHAVTHVTTTSQATPPVCLLGCVEGSVVFVTPLSNLPTRFLLSWAIFLSRACPSTVYGTTFPCVIPHLSVASCAW